MDIFLLFLGMGFFVFLICLGAVIAYKATERDKKED